MTLFAVTLAFEILLVKLRNQIIAFVRGENPDGFGHVQNCIRAQIHANSVLRVKTILLGL